MLLLLARQSSKSKKPSKDMQDVGTIIAILGDAIMILQGTK
jgi:hypothetical protein